MKILFFTLLILVVLFSSCSQETIELTADDMAAVRLAYEDEVDERAKIHIAEKFLKKDQENK